MNVPANLRYTDSHEWLRAETDGTVTVGITDHAQAALGDLVFVELPAVGRQLKAGEACAIVESVKAASDVYAPIAGQVVAVNEALPGAPGSAERGCLRRVAVQDQARGRRGHHRDARRRGLRKADRRRLKAHIR